MTSKHISLMKCRDLYEAIILSKMDTTGTLRTICREQDVCFFLEPVMHLVLLRV